MKRLTRLFSIYRRKPRLTLGAILISSLGAMPTVHAKDTITISFGQSLPPWVMVNTKNGILIELAKHCLEPSGYKVEPNFYPYARRITAYRTGQTDAASDVNFKTIKKENLKGHFTGIIYAYENFAYSLSKNNFKIKTVSDLKNYSLLSWQGAIDQIGGEYALMAKNNPRYSETHSQSEQVQSLFSGRVDFVQMDSQIFEFYKKVDYKNKRVDTTQQFDKFALFGQNGNGFIFRSDKVKTAFLKNCSDLSRNEKFKNILYRKAQ